MAELVQIVHPDIPDAVPGTCSREAFEQVWEPKGWKTVTADEAEKLTAAAAAQQAEADAAAAHETAQASTGAAKASSRETAK